MAELSQENTTIIGADAHFKGDLSFDSSAKVLGKFEGSIDSKGKLLIADGSNCKATVMAKEVAIEGHIEGDVQATDRVDVKPTGIVTGDIVATRMSMAEGASINGHCRIGEVKGSGATEVKPSTAAARPAAAAKTATASSNK
jgi:cytoskeletal protein CcmA (bactofilin family)